MIPHIGTPVRREGLNVIDSTEQVIATCPTEWLADAIVEVFNALNDERKPE